MAFRNPVAGRAWLRAYQRVWCHARTARWRAAGACTRCGTPVEKFRLCLACRVRSMTTHHAARARQPRRYCPVHPRTVIVAVGCQRCAAQRRAARRWHTEPGELLARVHAALQGGDFANVRSLADQARVSVPTVRKAIRRLRVSPPAGQRLRWVTGLSPRTGCPLKCYRLVNAVARSKRAA